MENGLWGSEAMWVSISAIVSAAVSGVTAAMAIFTRDLAVQTKAMYDASNEQAFQAERHHRQGLSPVVVAKLAASSSKYGAANTRIDIKGYN